MLSILWVFVLLSPIFTNAMVELHDLTKEPPPGFTQNDKAEMLTCKGIGMCATYTADWYLKRKDDESTFYILYLVELRKGGNKHFPVAFNFNHNRWNVVPCSVWKPKERQVDFYNNENEARDAVKKFLNPQTPEMHALPPEVVKSRPSLMESAELALSQLLTDAVNKAFGEGSASVVKPPSAQT